MRMRQKTAGKTYEDNIDPNNGFALHGQFSALAGQFSTLHGQFSALPGQFRFLDWIEKAALAAGAVCVGGVLVLLLFCGEYPHRLADNRYLMLIVLGLVLLMGIGWAFWDDRKKKALPHPVLWLCAGYLLLLILQILWVEHVYFYAGWDVGVMRVRVDGILHGSSMAAVQADTEYSTYPNNLFLFYLLCLIEKAGTLLSMEKPYQLCIYVSCLSVNLSCLFGNLIVRKLTDSGVLRAAYTLVSTVVILFSPWIIIPYSDTYGMLFVMAGLWGMLCVERKYLKWVIVTFAAVIGYRIKPTGIFPLGAAYLFYGLRFFADLRSRWRELLSLLLSTVFFWAAGLLIPLWIQHTYNFRLIPELKMPAVHYMMMGFNETTKGAYNFSDYLMSRGFPDVESRREADWEVLKQRLEEMVREGRLAAFLADKALVNFNDGTFAWTGEGDFFLEFMDHDNVLSRWFGRVMAPADSYQGENDGRYYPLYRTVMQVFWLLMLTGIPLTALDMRNCRRDRAVIIFVLTGLMAFVMLFEARARYLYLYSPAFLILSLSGFQALYRRARTGIREI